MTIMDIFILLVICGFFTVTVCRPSDERSPRLRDSLLSRLRTLHNQRRQVAGNDDAQCGSVLAEDVTNLFESALNAARRIPIPVTISIIQPDNKPTLEEASKKFFGLNIFDIENVQKQICEMEKAHSVRDMKKVMDPIHRGLFELAYIYTTLAAPISLLRADPDKQQKYHTLEQLGLINLDDDNVQWVLEISGFEDIYKMITAGYKAAEPSTTSLDQRCSILHELVETTLSLVPQPVASLIELWTGVDLNNGDKLHTFLCRILGAGTIQELFDVLDQEDVIDRVYILGYPMLSGLVRQVIQDIEYQLDMLENISNMPPNAGPPSSYGNYEYGYVNYDNDQLQTNELPDYYYTYPRAGYNGEPHGGLSGPGGPYGGSSGPGGPYGGSSGPGGPYGGSSGPHNISPGNSEWLMLLKQILKFFKDLEKSGLLNLKMDYII